MAGRKRKILVTGAAGSVGYMVVQEALAAGYQVVATDRRPVEGLPREVQWIKADLTRRVEAARLVQGVDAVVHTAAWVDVHASFEEQAPINLDAVRYLYDAAEGGGVGIFIHFSTGSLYAPSDAPISEDWPLMPLSGYEQAKVLAEDYLRSKVGAGPVVNMLRPALIYGPRGKVLVNAVATVPVLLSMLGGRVPGLRGGPRTNLVHCLDVARAALFLVGSPQADGEAFNVAAPEVSTIGDYAKVILDAGGVETLPVSIPFPTSVLGVVEPLLEYPELFQAFNRGLSLVWSGIRRRHGLALDGVEPRLDAEALPYVTHDTVFDGSKLVGLGFEYRYPDFSSGWEDTVRWYVDHGWLPAQG